MKAMNSFSSSQISSSDRIPCKNYSEKKPLSVHHKPLDSYMNTQNNHVKLQHSLNAYQA